MESQIEQYVLKIDLSARLRELRFGERYKRPWEDDGSEFTPYRKNRKIL